MSQSASLDLTLHPKQGEALSTAANEVLYGGAAGGGKALCVSTPIPTPSGWSTMGALRVGDQVLDEDGKPCIVIAATEAMSDRPCYRVTFCDGAQIVADAGHQWLTFNNADRAAIQRRSDEYRDRRRAGRSLRGQGKRPDLAKANATRDYEYLDAPTGSVRTTEQISQTLHVGARTNHAVPVCAGLDLPPVDMPIPPYVLGVWLGDGTRGQGSITTADEQIVQEVAACGFIVRKRASPYGYGVLGLQEKLRTLGITHSKRIPERYLRASAAQRMELLRGLMDTDGTINLAGTCEFDNCDRGLIEGVHELLASLGIKARISEGRATLNGEDCGPKYRLKFATSRHVFKLKRKLDRLPKSERGTQRWRMIKSVERIESVPVRCIEVDSPSHLFLAGREMIPTHNSHLMRVAAVLWCSSIPGLQVYLFRRIREDLVKNHMEGPKGFRAMLAGWAQEKFVTIVDDEIRFWNGSKIYLCHCKDEKDIYKYQGAEIHVLLIDELTHFLEGMYRFLRNRVRMVGVKLPEQYAGRFPRILCGANPGNIGHLWVKRTFVDEGRPGMTRLMDKSEGGMNRQFIRAQLEDNPSMTSDDPGYESRLEGLGSKALVQAMRHGDWDVIEGAFFDEWDASRHILRPFTVPREWKRYRSMDWGSASPFSVGWWALVSDDVEADNLYGNPVVIPRGALVRYREWYGSKGPNEGLKLDAETVGKGIAERSVLKLDDGMRIAEDYARSVLDPAAFANHGGPSIAEMLIKGGATFSRADNTRVPQRGAMSGWDQVRRRLKGDDEGRAMMFVFSTCVDTIRTLPALQHDKDRPEDLNTDMEDHAADDVRYACNARPWLPIPKPERPKNFTYVTDETTGIIKSTMSIGEIIKRQGKASKHRKPLR